VIQYALGQWGNEGSAHMDNEVRAKILDRKRARELAEVKHAEPTLEEVRRQYGGAHLSDEELILRYYAGPEFVDALKSAPPRKEYLDGRKPLVRLMEEIGKRKQTGYVSIRRGDFSLELRRASVD